MEKGVVNHYLNFVVAPLKTLSFKEEVLLLEEVNAPRCREPWRRDYRLWKIQPSGMAP